MSTTSCTTLTDVIKLGQPAAALNSNDDAKAALVNGQLDSLVLDLSSGAG